MFRLQRYFSIASAVAIIVVTVALAFLYRQNAVENLARIIESQNVKLAQSFANVIWPEYEIYVKASSQASGDELRARPETLEIHQALKTLTAGLPVLKVKMYSLGGNTIYSSDFTQIGDRKNDNAGFEATIRRGGPSTKSSFRESFLSFRGVVKDRHLIESYLPIRGTNGAVEGVFELYADVTPLIAEIGDKTTIVVLYLLAGLGLLYGVLFLIVHRADRIMQLQYFDLEHEITERKLTEEKYKFATEAAEHASNAKSEFLAAMSHEVRTPMAGIIGLSDLLSNTKMSPEQMEWTHSIKTSGQNLMTILNEILDQSKLDASMLELSPGNFSLALLIEETIQIFLPKMEEKGLSIEVVFGPDLPDNIYADRLRIGQVLTNLLSNALKFTDHGGIVVTISRQPSDDGSVLLHFAVKDSGIGLSRDRQGRLFSPFVQADSSTSRTYGGTGLGLSISKQLSEMMGGAIGIESQLGAGSVFWFTVRCQIAAGKVEAVGGALAKGRWTATRALKILVAEDNAVIQQLITAIFGQLNHEIILADDGRQATEIFARMDFDIIVMDVRMPEMDGLEATAVIRAMGGEKSKIPIIALTADIAVGNIRKYLEAGMDDVCAKPLNLHVLLKTINSQLGEEVHVFTEQSALDETLAPADEVRIVMPTDSFEQILAEVSEIVDQVSATRKIIVELPPELASLGVEKFIELQTTYEHNLTRQCAELMATLRELRRSPADEALNGDIRFIAHSLKGGGGTFGYQLVTLIAADVDAFLKSKDTLGQQDFRRLNRHVEALSLIAEKSISGDGGEAGRMLFQGLKDHASLTL